MPKNTPHAKKAVVTCCSHNHGRPIVRVMTSQPTDSVNMKMHTPHSTISTASSTSNARHLRWRCGCRISARWSGIGGGGMRALKGGRPRDLLDVAHHLQDLDRMRAQLGGQLVLDRRGGLHEAGLVDVVDHLDAHALELV